MACLCFLFVSSSNLVFTMCILIAYYLACLALPPGTPKVKVGNPEATTVLKGEWEKLSEQEMLDMTEECYQQLIEDKKTKLTGGHNSSITLFHDAMSNLHVIEDAVSTLCMIYSTVQYDLITF